MYFCSCSDATVDWLLNIVEYVVAAGAGEEGVMVQAYLNGCLRSDVLLDVSLAAISSEVCLDFIR